MRCDEGEVGGGEGEGAFRLKAPAPALGGGEGKIDEVTSTLQVDRGETQRVQRGDELLPNPDSLPASREIRDDLPPSLSCTCTLTLLNLAALAMHLKRPQQVLPLLLPTTFHNAPLRSPRHCEAHCNTTYASCPPPQLSCTRGPVPPLADIGGVGDAPETGPNSITTTAASTFTHCALAPPP